MASLSNYIASRKNLFPHSTAVSAFLLLALFILANFLTYRLFAEEPEEEKTEIREVEKLVIPPKIPPEPKKFVRQKTEPKKNTSPPKQPQPKPQEAVSPKVNVADLMAGLETKTLIATRDAGSRSSPGKNMNVSQVRVDANAAPHEFDPHSDFTAAVAVGSGRSRVGAPGNNRGAGVGAGVDVGEGSGVGTGTGMSAFSTGGGTGIGRRSGKGVGNGVGNGTTIGIPGGMGDGGEGGISIHDLIKWMKAHPGTIPRLIQHDMSHKAGDLSSAVKFTMNGRHFELFLSCNEKELLLRICLVENTEFTMLKDNGIKEASNYLSTGDVIRQATDIQSLITSRQAPGDVASQFYKIFWSWWEGEHAKMK